MNMKRPFWVSIELKGSVWDSVTNNIASKEIHEHYQGGLFWLAHRM